MSYSLSISKKAESDIIKLQQSGDKNALTKLNKLLNELREHPETGTGKPERLKYANHWSKKLYLCRIN